MKSKYDDSNLENKIHLTALQLPYINDKYKGIHVIDNKNPENPVKIAFIKIAGNVDISVKDNYLYADSLKDLLVFNISNIVLFLNKFF